MSMSAEQSRLSKAGITWRPILSAPVMSIMLLTATVCPGAAGETRGDDSSDQVQQQVQVMWNITDVVLARHIEPPVRQQMLLDAIRAAYRRAGIPVPSDTDDRLSNTSDPQQLKALLADLLHPAAVAINDDAAFEQVLMAGMMHAIPGPVRYIPRDEYLVEQSLRENRYVGIGIVLGVRGEYSQITKPLPRGPASIGGALAGDLIVAIDGESARGWELGDVVDALRGPLGTEVTIDVVQPDSDAVRTIAMVRDVVPIATVEGTQLNEDETWNFQALPGDTTLGFVRLTTIGGSTAHELRMAARSFQLAGYQGMILDLRDTTSGDLHSTVMVADALLDGDPIGQVQRQDGVETFVSRTECILADLPIVVLVNGLTFGSVEWLVAALSDNGRVKVVGVPTVSNGFVTELAEIEDGNGAINFLPAGYFLRHDGSRLSELVVTAHRSLTDSPDREVWRRLSGGVTPDREVALEGDDTSMYPNASSTPDAQVLAAVEILREEIADRVRVSTRPARGE